MMIRIRVIRKKLENNRSIHHNKNNNENNESDKNDNENGKNNNENDQSNESNRSIHKNNNNKQDNENGKMIMGMIKAMRVTGVNRIITIKLKTIRIARVITIFI